MADLDDVLTPVLRVVRAPAGTDQTHAADYCSDAAPTEAQSA